MSHSVCPPEGHTVLQEKWRVYPYSIQNLGMCQTKLPWLSGFPCCIMSHYFSINHSSHLENIIFSHLNLLKKKRHLHMHTNTHTHTPAHFFSCAHATYLKDSKNGVNSHMNFHKLPSVNKTPVETVCKIMFICALAHFFFPKNRICMFDHNLIRVYDPKQLKNNSCSSGCKSPLYCNIVGRNQGLLISVFPACTVY